MMHQKKSKKIFLYFFLLFLFGSITNISFQNSKLLSLKNITVSGLDDENNLDIINNLKRLKFQIKSLGLPLTNSKNFSPNFIIRYQYYYLYFSSV